MKDFDTPRTKTMKKFLEKEGPNGTGRVVGLSIEPDGVFIYTNSAEWCDDAGSGTFREDSETAAIRWFYEVVRKTDPVFYAAEQRAAFGETNTPNATKDASMNRKLTPNAAKFLAKNPTFIGRVAGYLFYESIAHGDEVSLLVITLDGRLKQSSFWELPTVHDVMFAERYNTMFEDGLPVRPLIGE